ncbi:HlyD family secretion protein [Photobacterium sanguinicancri]|uniref:HlyD family secretion protein n=1 Tax=Photobacterium sanguinicancri TaxID=875932 RepID=UPI0026E3DBD6|nr:HlyD family secretion protein [Photobacterium sanguinicancri]MDO6498035.1 HlyD family secretion protein [Photobacterium sanguinicancri]
MKDTIYKYAIYTVFVCTLGFSAFLISSDNISPFTTQATLHKTVANIAPEVSGVITTVYVNNGQHVSAGDPLFSIDKHSYELAVRQARAELHQALESKSAKWQELQSANQVLSQRNIEWHNTNNKFIRYKKLFNKGLITQQDFDDARMNVNVAKSAVEVANADILRIQTELSGVVTADSSTHKIQARISKASNQAKSAAIEIAEVKLAAAQLDLARTDVVAQTAGTISNLQLQTGTYINKGSVSLFLVNEDNRWLSADFNEKGIAHLQAGRSVWVSFDALPGQVFTGSITNQDRAIFDASNPTNQLSTVVNDSRWIREQQKIRTRIHVEGASSALIAGSRASVMVENGQSTLVNAIGFYWIKLVSWFRYIY